MNIHRVTNGKLYAHKKEREKYVKTGCVVTKPEDLLAVGIKADYDFLGLTIEYMVEKYDFDEDDKMGVMNSHILIIFCQMTKVVFSQMRNLKQKLMLCQLFIIFHKGQT